MSAMTMIVPTLVLIVGVVDDLRLKRVPNQHILGFVFVSIVSAAIVTGGPGIIQGVLACLLSFILMFPLVLGKVLGAGDMKLLGAASLALDWKATLIILLSSMVWGALFGVLRAALEGRIVVLLKNTAQLINGRKPETLEMTRIPFTIALIFGWFTYVGSFAWGGFAL